MVQPLVFDVYDRETKQYLPYVDNGISYGAYKGNFLTSQASFYNNPPSGVVNIAVTGAVTPSYSESRFESSSLNRIQERGGRVRFGSQQSVEPRQPDGQC